MEFDLSLSNKFKYDRINNKIVHVFNRNEYINFFNDNNSSNNIQDIIAIVGDNGNGKTTLLKLIAEIIGFSEDNFIASNFIIVVSEKNTYFEIYTNIYDLIIPDNKDASNLRYETYIYGIDNNIPAIADKINLIYYSNAFDNSATIQKGINHENVFDISTMYLLKNDKLTNESDNSLINHIQSEYIRQIEFVTSYQNSEKHLKFDIPKEIYINTKGIDNKMDKLINLVEPHEHYKYSNNITEDEYYNRENLEQALESIKNIFNKSIKKYVLDAPSYMKVRLIYLHLVISLYSYIKNIDFSRAAIWEISSIVDFGKALDENNIINSCIEHDEEHGLLLHQLNTKYILNDIEEKDYILSPLDLDYANDTVIYDINKLMSILKKTESKLYKKVKKSKKDEIEYIKSSVFELFELVCLNGINEGMIEIFWPLSTGEYNLLSLYSRLHELHNAMGGDKLIDHKSIILLLDEGENSLHPRWQQQYVKSIIDLINDIFENASVQIIFTTHSPILLSDIPGDNVIYLNKDNKRIENLKTFGANIYDLYNNSFFLDNSPTTGVIGTFADGMIKNVIERLKKIENDLNKIKKLNISIEQEDKDTFKCYLKEVKMVIDFIGEKVVKDILVDKYKEVENLIQVDEKESKIEEYYRTLNPDEKKELIRLLLDEEL